MFQAAATLAGLLGYAASSFLHLGYLMVENQSEPLYSDGSIHDLFLSKEGIDKPIRNYLSVR
jgi:hypothetical protein